MITVKIGKRGQFTLPGIIRKAIGLNEGDRVLLIQKGDQVIMHALPQTLFDLRGSIPVTTEQDFGLIRQKVTSNLGKKAAKDEK